MKRLLKVTNVSRCTNLVIMEEGKDPAQVRIQGASVTNMGRSGRWDANPIRPFSTERGFDITTCTKRNRDNERDYSESN